MTNREAMKACILEHRNKRGIPPKNPSPPVRWPPTRYPVDPLPPVQLSGLGCGCDDQSGAQVNVEQKDFTLDPIFKWGVIIALGFIALKK